MRDGSSIRSTNSIRQDSIAAVAAADVLVKKAAEKQNTKESINKRIAESSIK